MTKIYIHPTALTAPQKIRALEQNTGRQAIATPGRPAQLISPRDCTAARRIIAKLRRQPRANHSAPGPDAA